MHAASWLAVMWWLIAEPGEVQIRSASYSPPSAKITAQSNLVEVGVVVRDGKGRETRGFTIADFSVLDNGKPSSITSFSELRSSAPTTEHPTSTSASRSPSPSSQAEPPRARSVALFFDDMHLPQPPLFASARAAEKMIRAGLPSGERIGIFTDSGNVTVDFTTDTAALLAALPQIKPHTDPAARIMANCPTLTPYMAYVIADFIDPAVKEAAVIEVIGCDHVPREVAEGKVMDAANAIWENSRHYSTTALDILKLIVGHLTKQTGDRVLVLVSGGFIDDDRMRSEITGILDSARRDHVIINSLGAVTLSGFSRLILLNAMGDAAAATGGRLITDTNDLDGALAGLATTPEISYLLGFQASDPDGKYHTLRTALPKHAGYKIESRPGYFAAPSASTVQQRIDSAVLSKAVKQEFPASVRVIPAGNTLKVTVDVDAKHIRFAAQDGLHLQQLTFVTAIEDEQGNFVTGKQAVMDLRVKSATLASMQATGIHAVESFSLPKGVYMIREVVRELVQDRMASSNTPVNLQ